MRAPDKTALQFHSAVNTPLSELFYPGVGSVCLHKRLNKCIQSAVSDIQETTGCKSRKNKLLNLLLNIVPADGDPGAFCLHATVIYTVYVIKTSSPGYHSQQLVLSYFPLHNVLLT